MSGTNPDLLHGAGGGHKTARQPTPGAEGWTLTKDGHTIRAELRCHQAAGWELQLWADSEFTRGTRHPTGAAALQQAAAWRVALEAKGWR